jgi:hypothetical protein
LKERDPADKKQLLSYLQRGAFTRPQIRFGLSLDGAEGLPLSLRWKASRSSPLSAITLSADAACDDLLILQNNV